MKPALEREQLSPRTTSEIVPLNVFRGSAHRLHQAWNQTCPKRKTRPPLWACKSEEEEERTMRKEGRCGGGVSACRVKAHQHQPLHSVQLTSCQWETKMKRSATTTDLWGNFLVSSNESKQLLKLLAGVPVWRECSIWPGPRGPGRH